MKCPYCNNPDTRVIDSRPAEDGSSIRRRRSCDVCGKRFTTYEKVETIPLTVIKKDNTREQYDCRKVENGVVRACYKRPVATADIQKVVDRIETKVFSLEEKEIPSSVIGEAVMDELKALDEVAYVRFASVYREFKESRPSTLSAVPLRAERISTRVSRSVCRSVRSTLMPSSLGRFRSSSTRS